MRDAINPAESDFYQAIIWISDTKPSWFDQLIKDKQWVGVQWHHCTISQLPDTSECATALVVIDTLNEESFLPLANWAKSIEAQGLLIGTIITLSWRKAILLYNFWCNQISNIRHDSDEKAMPLIVGTEDTCTATAALRLFNAITYGALTVCIDWFDIRLASYTWSRACRYRHSSADDFAQALQFFIETRGDSQAVLALSEEMSIDLNHFTAIADALEACIAGEASYLCTQLLFENEEQTTRFHWLELLPEEMLFEYSSDLKFHRQATA